MKTTKKNPYLRVANELNNISNLVDITFDTEDKKDEKYRVLKGKIKAAQMKNIFAAMEAYCKK